VRHLGSKRDMGVDPNTTKVESLAKAHGGCVILGPNAGSQTVLHVVGVSQRLVGVLELLDSNNRAKNFALDVLILLL